MWVLTVLYPLGAALAGAIGFAFAPLVRRAWKAGLLGFVALFPMFALISIAAEPYGPKPYHIQWGVAAIGAALVGGLAGLLIFKRGRTGEKSRGGRHQGHAA
jgi:drug/metabolite transporter (DMT)-like permease